MNGWNNGISRAIAYIEEHLTEELDMDEIAARAYVSGFYFQKIFHVLCGFTIGEYIRSRRLTLAAQELCASDVKVIDLAVKYGYDSPDSFTRAFTRFHGVTPSAARKEGCPLNFAAPLKIKLTLEGSTMLEYRIVKKDAIIFLGVSRRFSEENSYKEIPKFWDEFLKSEQAKTVRGMYGICLDGSTKSFDYLIADECAPDAEVPEGFEQRCLPGGTWAVFLCRGKLPDALQTVNTRIWSEWLPSCKNYRLAGNYNLERYTEDPEYTEIWLPVEPVTAE